MNERRAFFREIAAAALSVTGAAERAMADTEDIERYRRQLAAPDWGPQAQAARAGAGVLVVGAGALAAPVAQYLAGAGVGRLGIVDDGDVELAGLHAELLHYTPDVGEPKVHSAVAKLRFLNPDVVVEPYPARFDAAMVEGQDLVVDCSDAARTRIAVNDACCGWEVPLVSGGLGALHGHLLTVRPGETACLRCAFPDALPPAASGVIGPAAGIVGSLMALRAMALLGGRERVAGELLHVDLHALAVTREAVARRSGCEVCGAVR